MVGGDGEERVPLPWFRFSRPPGGIRKEKFWGLLFQIPKDIGVI